MKLLAALRDNPGANLLAAVHLVLFCLMLTFVSHHAEASIEWIILAVIDLPWTVLIYASLDDSSLAMAVHMVVGTVWWWLIGFGISRLFRFFLRDRKG